MTIQEALDELDAMMPNAVARETKVKWLSVLDGTIHNEVIMTHMPDGWECEHTCDARHDWKDPLSEGDVRKPPKGCGPQWQEFEGYNDATPLYRQLIVPYPYTDVYRFYMAAQCSLVNKELDDYNNFSAMYNTALDTYKKWYNRTHMPIKRVGGFRL